ncbi:MAG: site-2 protease family protein [Legionellaceae bacterium]|nr:site-2 protease family protein [Legionellaceae bacterium]
MHFTIFENIALWVIPILLGITLHEASHAYVADALGDSTAKQQGRLSLNPLRHIDWIGTVLFPIALLILSNFQFTLGWAKPVPVNAANFQKPLPHMALVSFAGPAANFLMVLLWAMLLKVVVISSGDLTQNLAFFEQMAHFGIIINLVLAFLNLLPIPPLDGSRIAAWLMPPRWVSSYYTLEPYGIFILIALLATGILKHTLLPFVWYSRAFVLHLLGISG